jgi:hypothetical protein
MAYKIEPKLFKRWSAMKRRCNNPNCLEYRWYGARGITVCKEWNSFRVFEKDMLPTYRNGLYLERIDNNKGYYKENCRWATPKDQATNRRNTKLFEFNNMKKTLTDWAKEIGIKRSTLAQRFYVYGWSVEQCLRKGGQIG